jgi:penicillin-binding protein 1A
MPIGANEVTVLDHTGGYATFVNSGRAVVPHAVLEVRNGAGHLVWRFDRDGKKPVQVITPSVAFDMNMMMNAVVEAGTARRAQLDGIKAAGKTGTTNAHRDAWFVGYTGNFVCGVWYGNDDYAPMGQMTGGSLPAMTWKEIMGYAHQGIELKEIPGLGPRPSGKQVAGAPKETPVVAIRPTSLLTKRGSDVLARVERLMDEAARALAARGEPPAAQGKSAQAGSGAVASSERSPAGQVRGN